MWTEDNNREYIDGLFDSLASMLQEQDAAFEANNHVGFMETVRPIGATIASLLNEGYTLDEITAAVDMRHSEE